MSPSAVSTVGRRSFLVGGLVDTLWLLELASFRFGLRLGVCDVGGWCLIVLSSSFVCCGSPDGFPDPLWHFIICDALCHLWAFKVLLWLALTLRSGGKVVPFLRLYFRTSCCRLLPVPLSFAETVFWSVGRLSTVGCLPPSCRGFRSCWLVALSGWSWCGAPLLGRIRGGLGRVSPSRPLCQVRIEVGVTSL